MSVAKLVTALTIIFVVSVVFLVAELLFILRRRRFFPPQSTQPPISGDDQNPTKLLFFFGLKSETRVEPSEALVDDPVIDVFKLLEANGRSRVLCTIKEDDREDVESNSMSVVDSVEIVSSTPEKVWLQACFESEAAAERVFSSPCDSPMFFTPMGSPARDGMSSELVSPVSGNSCATAGGW
ncbi:hypothetical protein L1987_00337 [Smallanthus sonchifolius]|uniref:Uncharacterized protein n=1 Tax=Smallanthus sonchifolius TaxID=185202 RepID=A0ACB9K1V2_9ASTR|nr:hypothetical protein L1987_00337 [Smallanthus sonchifolius]